MTSPWLILAFLPISFSTAGFAQTDAPRAPALNATAGKPGVSSAAQTTFTLMKTLAGTWQGSVTTDNPAWATNKPLPLSFALLRMEAR